MEGAFTRVFGNALGEAEMDLEAKLASAPRSRTGVLVEAPDGRIFFLPDS